MKDGTKKVIVAGGLGILALYLFSNIGNSGGGGESGGGSYGGGGGILSYLPWDTGASAPSGTTTNIYLPAADTPAANTTTTTTSGGGTTKKASASGLGAAADKGTVGTGQGDGGVGGGFGGGYGGARGDTDTTKKGTVWSALSQKVPDSKILSGINKVTQNSTVKKALGWS